MQAPPTTLAELEEYIRETVRKELSRGTIEFGPELGAGEFGAVFRGEHVATDVESGALTKQTVAIKLLKNCECYTFVSFCFVWFGFYAGSDCPSSCSFDRQPQRMRTRCAS